jgi:hypothetical protein
MDISNEGRRERGVAVWNAHAALNDDHDGNDSQTNLSDLLADLFHWAADERLDVQAAVRTALMHVEMEREEEGEEDEDANDVQTIKASDCEPGDRVVFSDGSGYTIEEVETTGIGGTRHHFNDGTASNAYGPDERLNVIRGR